MDEPYYRIYDSEHGPVVVCMQWFDEFDYNQELFLSPEKFETEEDAYAELLIIRAKILDEYLRNKPEIDKWVDEMSMFFRENEAKYG